MRWLRRWKERRKVGAGGDERTGPSDELEAMRVQLLAKMRRQPADMRALLRGAEGLFRTMAARERMSPRASKDLAANFERVLESFGSQILPPQ